jgi:hypothetical protein
MVSSHRPAPGAPPRGVAGAQRPARPAGPPAAADSAPADRPPSRRSAGRAGPPSDTQGRLVGSLPEAGARFLAGLRAGGRGRGMGSRGARRLRSATAAAAPPPPWGQASPHDGGHERKLKRAGRGRRGDDATARTSPRAAGPGATGGADRRLALSLRGIRRRGAPRRAWRGTSRRSRPRSSCRRSS